MTNFSGHSHSYVHLDIYSGLNSHLNRQHHRLESRYSSSSGGSYEEEKSNTFQMCFFVSVFNNYDGQVYYHYSNVNY